MMALFERLFDYAGTEVERTFDRWMVGLADTIPVPYKVRFTCHSIAPVVNVPALAAWYAKSFQGHQFAIGRSKK